MKALSEWFVFMLESLPPMVQLVLAVAAIGLSGLVLLVIMSVLLFRDFECKWFAVRSKKRARTKAKTGGRRAADTRK